LPKITWDKHACKFCPDPPCLSCPFEWWFDPFRLVQFELPLRNILPIDAVDVNVSMVQNANVKPLLGSQNYGALVGQGPAVSRTFQFQFQTAVGGPAGAATGALPAGTSGYCGNTIPVEFQIMDGNNELGRIVVPFRVGMPSYPLLQDFERVQPPGLPEGWSAESTYSPVPWSSATNPPPNTMPHGESEDLVIVQPPNVTLFTSADSPGLSYLTSAPFAVGSDRAQLYFQQAFNLADPDDGGFLEIAIGTEPFQDIQEAGGQFADGSYNTRLSDRNQFALRPAWSGDSGGWVPVSVYLPPRAVGQRVQLRWFLSNARGMTTGFWYLDSVLVSEPYCPPRDLVIVNPVLNAAGFSFGINTETNRTYRVEYNTNLNTAAWFYLDSILGDGSLKTIVVPTSDWHRFYRINRQ
jgi:hypothetical protein